MTAIEFQPDRSNYGPFDVLLFKGADGTKLNKRVDFPRGHAKNPMTDEEVVAKFHRMAQGVVSDKTAVTILDYAWNLDKRNRELVRAYLARVEARADREEVVP